MGSMRLALGLTVAMVVGVPCEGWGIEKSKRELLKERFQQKNILLNAPASGAAFGGASISHEDSQVYQQMEPQSSMPAQSAEPVSQAQQLRRHSDVTQRGDGARIWQPVVSYAIYQTDYQVEIEEDIAFVRERVEFEVFKAPGAARIPLVNADVGLKEVSLNQKPSIINREGRKYVLLVSKPGRYHLDLEFFVRVAREREHGPGQFAFEVLASPISLLDVQIHEPNMDLFVEPSIKLEKETVGGRTLATAVLPYTEVVTVRWNKAVGKVDIAPVVLEPKLFADVASLVSVGEGILHGFSDVRYSILQSEVSMLSAWLPADVTVLDVQAGNLRDWKVTTRESRQVLDVYLDRGMKGAYTMRVVYEKAIGDGSVTAQLPELTIVGVEREQGLVGIQAKTNVEITFNRLSSATQIDVKELPGQLWNQAEYPILLAYKYLKHPVEATVDVIKHEELPVLVAAIDAAHYVTLLTREGKTLTKATLNTRNNVKQFMRLDLPKSATLLSCFVSGNPVKPAQDQAGKVLIPLEKSEALGETVAQFPVEVTYLSPAIPLRSAGELAMRLPSLDIPTSQLYWSVYLPEEWNYWYFRGDVELMAREVPLGLFTTLRQKVAQVEQYGSRSQLASQQVTMEQQAYDEFKGARASGVLPIKIEVPTAGRIFRLSKLLVTEESPWFRCVYARNLLKARGLIGWGVFLLVAIVVAALGRGVHGTSGALLAALAGGAALAGVWLAQVGSWVIVAAVLVGLIARRRAGRSTSSA